MMPELSLNVLDIVQNSVKAGATLITVDVLESVRDNSLVIEIGDNGCGMTKDQQAAVTNPFYTTRTTRKVGLGVPFFKMAAEMTGGSFDLWSEVGVGTKIRAEFVYDNIDRMPLGDMAGTICSLIQCNGGIDFVYRHSVDGREYVLDTREMREILGDVPIDDPQIVLFFRDYIREHDQEIDPSCGAK